MRLLGLALLSTGFLSADLEKVKAEPNAEKRSRAALDHAAQAFKLARQQYGSGDLRRTESLLDEMLAAVELADSSLRSTGKDARRSPKHFKKAEIELRELLRKLDNFEQDLAVEDRYLTSRPRERIRHLHEELLLGILGGRK
ncbi:MAG: hypothetical protein FJW37_02815 [Acidobacteria bacterium]|nr:hypothetical protein [Acidobacteriota bacterium]